MREKLSKFNEDLIKNYDEDCNRGYSLEIDVEYPKKLFNNHKDLPFLPKRKKAEKVKKFICNIEDKKNCFSYKSFKRSIKSRSKAKKGTQSNSD